MTTPGASLEAEIIAIVKRVSRRLVEPTNASDLELDLSFDSLLRYELIAELEGRFDISIPLNDIETIRTLAQVREHLDALIKRRDGPG